MKIFNPKLPQSHFLTIAIISCLTATAPFAIDSYLPALPTMAEDMATDLSTIELSLTSFFLGFAIGQINGGALSDQLGRRPIVLWGLLIFFISSVLISLTLNPYTLIALRFIQAFGGGFATVNSVPIIRDLYSGKEATKAVALMGLIMLLAPMVAPAVGTFLLLHIGWQSIFIFKALFTALAGILVLYFIPETKRKSRLNKHWASGFRKYRKIFKHSRALGYVGTIGFSMAAMFTFLTGSAWLYMSYFNLTETEYFYLFSTNVGAIILFNRLGVFLLNYTKSLNILRLGCFIQFVAMGCLTALYVSEQVLLLPTALAIILCCGSIGFIIPNGVSLYADTQRTHPGAAMAFLGAFQFTTGSIFGGIYNILPSSAPIKLIGVMFFLTILSNGCLYIWARRRKKRAIR